MPKNNNKNKGKFYVDDTKIYEVENMLPPLKVTRELDSRLPPIHFLLTFIAKSKSGKSNFIANYLMRDEFMGMAGENPMFEAVHVISPSIKSDRSMQLYRQDEVKDRFILYDNIENIEGIVRGIVEHQKEYDPDAEDPEEQPPNICIYIDDCSKYIKKSTYLEWIMTTYRHFRISIILSLQNIKGFPPVCRSQATGVWLARVYSDDERLKISEHFSESFKGKKNFYKIWDDACSDFYQFLYLNFSDFYPRAFKFGPEGLEEYHGIYPAEERKAGNLDYLSENRNIGNIDSDNDENENDDNI